MSKSEIDGDRVDIKDCIEDIIGDGNANPTMADCGYLLEFDDNYDEVDKFRTGRGLPCMFKDEVSKYSSGCFTYNQVKARIEAVGSQIWSLETSMQPTVIWILIR